jgi:hypothetical protein|tara:strand:+ start:1173 stop:1754 length:582 start_codon:yes stop_codon:yes gene_type:complete
MEPIDVYIMYCAMKAHFSRKDYDFFKYGGKTKVSRDSFWKRKDRFFFVKLSKKYKTEIEIRNYLVSNFIKDKSGYIANFSEENYKSWLLRRSGFFDQFVIEMKPFIKEFEPLFEVKNSSHPKLLKEFLGSRVSLETMLVLDELVSFSKKWDQQLEDDIVWVDLKKLMKNYKGFLTINKNRYRIKLLKLIEESN